MKPAWSILHLIFFRFIFLFFILWSSPWNWMPFLGDWIGNYKYYPAFWLHNYIISPGEIPVWTHGPTGSGDTYDDWLLFAIALALAILGTLSWSVLDRKRNEYIRLDYWFRVFLRYFLALVLFFYGIHKVFPHQMPFPNLAQLHTPLGDLSPMRLAWLFIGYSTPYEFFCGLMELVSGVLLIFRRTQLLGALLSATTLFNVMMLNYCYDIPVKLFSTQLFLMSCYLVAYDYKRLVSFFFQNQPVAAPDYGLEFNNRRHKIFRYSLFWIFFVYFIMYSFYKEYQFDLQIKNQPVFELLGAYLVKKQVINQTELKDPTDTLRWNQMVMGNGYTPGQSYGMVKRGIYLVDRTMQTIDSTQAYNIVFRDDTTRNFRGRYDRISENELKITGISRGDSVTVYLSKIEKPFKLETKPFHWISAYPY